MTITAVANSASSPTANSPISTSSPRGWTAGGSTTRGSGTTSWPTAASLELWLGEHPNTRWGVDQLPPSESASEGRQPVYATAIEIAGPDRLEVPYGTARYSASFTPEDTSLKYAYWSVTEPDGSPTDKADDRRDGKLTVNRQDGIVRVTARAADAQRR